MHLTRHDQHTFMSLHTVLAKHQGEEAHLRPATAPSELDQALVSC